MEAHKLRRVILVGSIALIVGSIVLFNVMSGMKEPPGQEEIRSTSVPVSVREVKTTSLMASVPITGRVISSQKFEVFTEVNGRLVSGAHPFKDGTRFKKGEVLLRINDSDVRLNVVSARSAFQSLISSILVDIKIDYTSSFETWSSFLADIDAGQALPELPKVTDSNLKGLLISRNVYNQYYSIKAQEENLAKFTVVAPFDGVVSDANVNPNTVLRAGQKVGNFIEVNAFEVEAGVSLKDVTKISVGNEVVLESKDLKQLWAGTVSRMSEVVDASTQNVKVYVGVEGRGLYEGLYLNGHIVGEEVGTGYEIENHLLSDENFVYAVENNALKRIEVEVLHEGTRLTKIGGLTNGTLLIDQAIPGAYEGMKIQVISKK